MTFTTWARVAKKSLYYPSFSNKPSFSASSHVIPYDIPSEVYTAMK